MRLILIFLLFFLTEYVLRTFVDAYKYHSVGLFLEFLPLTLSTVVAGLIYKTEISTGPFGWTYLKLIGVSISGLITIKTFLFIQWYWFIAPEYRNVPGDMIEGLGFTLLFLIFGIIVILLSTFIIMRRIISIHKKKIKTTTTNNG